VAGITNLQELEVRMNADVSDDGLTCARGLTILRKLFLSYTAVTDAGLANLEGLDKLQFLYLTSTRITVAGLSHFKDTQA
jgi:internalin A